MPSTRTAKRVLILDADMLPALAVARSLGARHYVVSVASAIQKPITAYSNSVFHCHHYPDPLQDRAAFLAWFENHTLTTLYDLVIPVTERSLLPLSSQRERLTHVNIALPSRESLALALDKTATFKLAESLGISTPQSFYIETLSQLERLPGDLRWPMVVKPSQTLADSAAGYTRREVSYAHSPDELQAQCTDCLRHSPAIVQAYFEGRGAGIELIASHGEILYAFQHERLHEVPLTGGGSSLRTSAEAAPELLEAASALMRAADWHGVAMVEFKWNPENRTYCLMEINGRFWGSLPLATAAGADFPAMLADLMLTGKVPPYPHYRSDVVCRNLGRDLMWHEMVLRTRDDPSVDTPTARSVVSDLLMIFSPRHYFDAQSLRDPLPGLIDILRILGQYRERIGGLLAMQYFALTQALLWRNGTIRERLLSAGSILFICYGNINRSVAAAALLAQRMPQSGRLAIISAGFHEEEGRQADPRMVAIAQAHGIDLSQNRSRCVTAQLVRDSDIIFAMEKRHIDQLIAIDPGSRERIFLLGAAVQRDGRGIEIPDPYNRSAEDYASCFMQIEQAVTNLSDALGARHA